ncbi:UDP-N-acetylglucosamine--peptide N-acetylglucosaminyltransferase [Folsomia candida]|uniref:UDP-N-acetylglucosamine--peptide N-acetylglucosaminyltransferase n=1 Tax=Folsomia candida TaxID=158441 RepID=A0A226F0N0_FOLCA|nr:UDP-N-acetylglucosamine--peptide N-acetylglucosaminyltransferase [Folsomia candida]
MDYILADERVVPLDNVDCFMEKVAYHPKSCYIGSHAAMYPFLRHNKRLRHKGRFIALALDNPIPSILMTNTGLQNAQELVDSGNLSFRFGGRVLLNGSKMKHSMLDKQSDTIIIMSRKHYGLPENKLVLACFNSMFKYTKEMWMCWMKPGIPVLTLTGQTFHSRVSTSLLHVLQLPVLIISTPEEYEERAIWLGNHPQALEELRELINVRKFESPLYDVKQFVSDLEHLCKKMWARFVSRKSPHHIFPEDGHDEWTVEFYII